MTVTPEELRSAADNPSPPAEICSLPASALLKALWLVARGNWDAAHELAQDDDSYDGAWVHAHLNRVEGDLNNAGYWYGRAGRPRSEAPLDNEWHDIAAALLSR